MRNAPALDDDPLHVSLAKMRFLATFALRRYNFIIKEKKL